MRYDSHLRINNDMRALCFIAAFLFIAPNFIAPEQAMSAELVLRVRSGERQEREERERRPANSETISGATREFQQAVNGKASVRNLCHSQGKDSEIEETAEVVETDRCKVVVKARKTTHAGNAQGNSTDRQQRVEFTVYADLSELTTPILVEPQKFAQCDAGGDGVLRVSSRSDPKKPIRVVRRSPNDPTKPDEGTKQTRRDLSLFFADPASARRAASALDRAVKACGGREWPDEDDLP
jgi:hypothetical protein